MSSSNIPMPTPEEFEVALRGMSPRFDALMQRDMKLWYQVCLDNNEKLKELVTYLPTSFALVAQSTLMSYLEEISKIRPLKREDIKYAVDCTINGIGSYIVNLIGNPEEDKEAKEYFYEAYCISILHNDSFSVSNEIFLDILSEICTQIPAECMKGIIKKHYLDNPQPLVALLLLQMCWDDIAAEKICRAFPESFNEAKKVETIAMLSSIVSEIEESIHQIEDQQN